MTKVGRPKGLVRYDSLNGLARKTRRILRPRIYAYAALALLGLSALGLTVATKARPYTATVARLEGTPFVADSTSVRNIYQIRVLNKRNQAATFTIRLSHDTPEGFELSGADQSFEVAPLGELSRSCVVFAAAKAYQGQRDLKIEIHGEPGNITLTETVKFLGPNPILLHEEAEKAGSHEDDDEKEHN
jgi:polyferredoxin